MYDLAIIGGGVNGCGIARDAAGRGLEVLLAEKGDLASATSSASTKLVHGGLRYLEHYEFQLVRESLMEREVLLRMAPHIIWPLRFVLPHHRGLRPALLIRLGLFLYDHLGGREILPASRGLDLGRDAAGAPLQPQYTKGFEYSDCWVEDSRLVVLTAVDAAQRGATVCVRTEVTSADRTDGHWTLTLTDSALGTRREVAARVLVNAAGPWVAQVIAERVRSNAQARVRLVKGSHIVVPRLFAHDRAYIFQNADRRIVFAIPYEERFTLIGTTDVDYQGDPGAVAISAEETRYLCDAVSAYVRTPVRPADVVWSYSGVRPLFDDGDAAAQAVTRDYVLERDGGPGKPTLLSVFGGKITTYRHLAEEALKLLAPDLPGMGPAWTAGSHLPGGDFAVDGVAAEIDAVRAAAPVLSPAVAGRLVRAYGTRARSIFAGARVPADLGVDFGGGLSEREVLHLMRHEWARSADDVLWRRSKLGLHLEPAQRAALAAWMDSHPADAVGTAA